MWGGNSSCHFQELQREGVKSDVDVDVDKDLSDRQTPRCGAERHQVKLERLAPLILQ